MLFQESSERLVISSVESWIKTNLAEPIFLRDTASVFNMNDEVLSDLILSVHGFSFSEMLRLLRLEAALKLMRDTDLTISDIATRVGYSSPNSLYRLIKRYTRLSPSQYRAKHEKPAGSNYLPGYQ